MCMKPKRPKLEVPPPPPPPKEAPEQAQYGRFATSMAGKRRKRPTLVTSGLGDQTVPTLFNKMLLGQ